MYETLKSVYNFYKYITKITWGRNLFAIISVQNGTPRNSGGLGVEVWTCCLLKKLLLRVEASEIAFAEKQDTLDHDWWQQSTHPGHHPRWMIVFALAHRLQECPSRLQVRHSFFPRELSAAIRSCVHRNRANLCDCGCDLYLSPEESQDLRRQDARSLCDWKSLANSDVSAMQTLQTTPTAEIPCDTSSAVKNC